MQPHLVYERHEAAAEDAGGNRRNSKSRKMVQSEEGAQQIETPRNRAGTFEPLLVKKRQVRLAGIEEKILALYVKGGARGTSSPRCSICTACRSRTR